MSENLELVTDQHGTASEWRCLRCGQVLSYFDQSCHRYNCTDKEMKGTWCPLHCMMVVGDL